MTLSQPFEDMAARIAKIDAKEFAGAIVVVPPGGGEAIAFMTTDPTPDIVQFWAAAEARIKVKSMEAMQEEEARRNNSRMFGR